ncbi:transglycosylase domain-containing protein [Pseudogracilibacillus sp. SO30301A]|uniref:transglycosylase domain-containing protein n=1 Tax=Pseudogracilibacillus sp. SO30301A TaxID=3098291 RepID=UPI00300DDCFC
MSNNYTSRVEKRHQRKKTNQHKRSWWKILLLSLGITCTLIVGGGAISVAVMINDAPELKESNLQMPQSTRIYDEDGKQIDTLFQEENRINVSIDEVPDVMKAAIISIEDKRFYDHNGIDWRRLIGAARSNIKHGWGAEGGSTLTQQVIKRTVLSPEKTLKRKVQEAWLAMKLEKKYSKDEILELYLNNVYYGHGAYGIKTAAVTYFGEEDLSQLSISQAALLAGLPNSPSATDPFKYPDKAEKRRDKVLESMVDNGFINKEQEAKAKEELVADIVLKEEKKQENDNPYNAYVDAVYDQLVNEEKVVSDDEFFQGGLKIYTHLDSDAQQATYDLLHSENIAYPDEDFEVGLSLVDTETGAIKAIGGGRNFKAIRYSNYGSNIKHHPGSTIKPILDYGPAIEHLKWPTSHILTDEPYAYSDGTPINEWDGKYWGSVSIRRALEWSRNIPALKAFQAVGADKAQAFAAGVGIDIDPIYESAAIGGFDGVSPLQMAAAYAAFGNGGTYNEPSAVKKVVFPDGKEWEPDLISEKAMEDYTAYMITDILKTVMVSGTGMQANIEGIPVAGKTGSTNIDQKDLEKYGITDGLRDSWFSGYTTEYSLTVWTGYPSMKNEDGDVQYIKYDGTQDIAKHLFRELMSEVSSSDVKDFVRPDSVVSIGSELHVRGAEPATPQKEPSNSSNQKQEEEEQNEQVDEEKEDEREEQEKQEEKEKQEKQEKQEDENQEEDDENEEDDVGNDDKQVDENEGQPDPDEETDDQDGENDRKEGGEKNNDNDGENGD